jgi:hypothetical protein
MTARDAMTRWIRRHIVDDDPYIDRIRADEPPRLVDKLIVLAAVLFTILFWCSVGYYLAA